MRILVIGSGGREHALVWKLKQSPRVSEVFVAPGNGGTAREGAINVAVDAGDLDGLVELARKEKIDLVVPGPELPLTKGITDRMREAGIPCFGPDAYCARLEGSKAFAKDVMNRAGVPTGPQPGLHRSRQSQERRGQTGRPPGGQGRRPGCRQGRGGGHDHPGSPGMPWTTSCASVRTVPPVPSSSSRSSSWARKPPSCACATARPPCPCLPPRTTRPPMTATRAPIPAAWGAYSPAPILPYNEAEAMADTVIRPILAALAKDGHPFVGVLYAGLMMTENGPKVLEYNTRFGDPECQPLLMRLEGDLVQIMLDCIEGKLRPESLTHTSQTALGVVVAAEGYPHAYPKGMVIEGLDEADALPGVKVFHSGTSMDGDKTLSSGGRVLCVTALGDTLADAPGPCL